MLRFLEILYQYNVLRAKQADPLMRLEDSEQALLVGLESMLRRDGPEVDGRRWMPRIACPLPVQFTMASGFGAGRLRDVSACGLGFEAGPVPDLGSQILVHITDEAQGVEYTFPARVVWAHPSAGGPAVRGQVGVELEGMPSRATLPAPIQRDTPMVA